jgi:head-tail adaptor
MTWLSPKLNRQIQVRVPVNTANDSGGFTRTYTTVSTVWGGFNPVKNASYVRGSQTISLSYNNQERGTHDFMVRRVAIDSLGMEYSSAFSTAYDSIADLNTFKSEFFFFVEVGSNVKGRLFRIINIMDNMEEKEFFIIRCEEIEEQGTGAPE